MRPQEIMGEIVILYLHPGTFLPSSPGPASPASGSLLMHLLFFLIVYHSYLFLSILSYTILYQLSSVARCLKLGACSFYFIPYNQLCSMISRLSTAGKTPPIKRAAKGMPYGRLFIISRTSSHPARMWLWALIGPANNDQSLCYGGGWRQNFQSTFGVPLRTHPVIVFNFTVNNDWSLPI